MCSAPAPTEAQKTSSTSGEAPITGPTRALEEHARRCCECQRDTRPPQRSKTQPCHKKTACFSCYASSSSLAPAYFGSGGAPSCSTTVFAPWWSLSTRDLGVSKPRSQSPAAACANFVQWVTHRKLLSKTPLSWWCRWVNRRRMRLLTLHNTLVSGVKNKQPVTTFAQRSS